VECLNEAILDFMAQRPKRSDDDGQRHAISQKRTTKNQLGCQPILRELKELLVNLSTPFPPTLSEIPKILFYSGVKHQMIKSNAKIAFICQSHHDISLANLLQFIKYKG
jgi:hypothetical protein